METTPAIDFSLLKTYFHISPEGADHPELTLPAAELLEAAPMLDLLQRTQQQYKALDLELPASFIGLSLYGLTAAQLILLAQYDVWVDLSLDNLDFQHEAHDDHAHAGYKLRELRTQSVPTGAERASFIVTAWTHQFQQTVVPLIENVARQAGVKPQMIWSQFGGRQSFLRDYIHENIQHEALLARFDDEDRRLSELPADLFGMRRNPYIHNPRRIASPYTEGKTVIIRSSCCMYYKREEGRKCYNCPMLTDTERESMKQTIQTG